MDHISIKDPKQIYPILDSKIFQVTRFASLNEPQTGDTIKLCYRESPEKSCWNCLNSKEVRGVECPYYDSKNHTKTKTMSDVLYKEHKRQSGTCKCIHHVNLLRDAVVTNVEHYTGFHLIPNLLIWANNQGFASLVDAKEHYDTTFGKGWEDSPLTVLSWELKKK
jgi:hypothetical protein